MKHNYSYCYTQSTRPRTYSSFIRSSATWIELMLVHIEVVERVFVLQVLFDNKVDLHQ